MDSGLSVRAKVVLAASWQVGGRLIQRSIGIVSTLVLARILTPEDFGIVAIAMLVVYFAQAFSESGSAQYILQVKNLDSRKLGTAWTLDIILKTFFAIAIWICLPLLPDKFSTGIVGQVVAVSAFGLILRSMINPQLHVERRELRYASIFKLQLIQKLSGFFVGITLAILTRSVWAIVTADLLSTCLGVYLSHRNFAKAPRFTLSHLREQISFSGWMLGRGVLGYVRATVDTVLVANYFPVGQLGRYNLAREITVLPATQIVQPAMEPLVPAFARANESGESVDYQVMLALLTLGCLVAPIGMFLYRFAEPMVALLLGPKWSGTELIIAALVPLLAAITLSSLFTNFLLGTGKVRLLFGFDVVTLVVTCVVMISLAGIVLEDFALYRGLLALAVTLPMLMYCLNSAGVKIPSAFNLIAMPWILAFIATILVPTNPFVGLGIWSIVPIGMFYVMIYGLLLLSFSLAFGRIEPAWSLIPDSLRVVRTHALRNKRH